MADPGAPPLAGVSVIDFSRIIAGPLCTQQLADMGAEVIKIENPARGDDTRRMADPGVAGESHFFLAFNRNKKSVAIDVRKPEVHDLVLDLIGRADVLVENFRPGVMKRLSLDYATLRREFPELVYLSVSAYGQVGPLADRPGFDPVMQAESGMMSLTGEPDGAPMRHPLSIVDTMTALHAVGAVTAALLSRSQGGGGQHIDLALMDVALAALGNAGMYYLCSGAPPPRAGNSHMTSTPTNLMETRDHPIYLALGTDRLFGQLCRDVIERPDLADDARFRTPFDRLRNRTVLFDILRQVFADRPRRHWLEKMRHLPAGPVRTLAEALESEQAVSRRMVLEIEHPSGERLRLIGSPLNFSKTPVRAPGAPPTLGQHTEEILGGELGVPARRLAALRQSGVIR